MIHINVITNRIRRLPRPRPLPVVTEQEARQWFSGWWHAMPLGFVIGLCVGVMVAGAFA